MTTELRRLRNYINGEFRDAADGRTTEVVNPATGEAYATAPLSGQADVDAAMAAAAAAFPAWRDTTPGRAPEGPAEDRRRLRGAGRGADRGRGRRTPASRSGSPGPRRSRRWWTRSASSRARPGCSRAARPASTWRA